MGVLYKLTSPSGKSYIGISLKSLDERWAKHVEHAIGKRSAGALYGALRKYTPEAFTKEVLAESDEWSMLCDMERTAIQSHNTFAPNGYNMTTGGEGIPGPRDAATKAKISIAQKKRFERPEERERLRLAGIAGAASPKAKAAAAARRKPPKVKMTKAERSQAIRDALARPEIKAKVLACAKQRSDSPHWRKRISESKRGAKIKMPARTPEWRAMIVELRRREWADPVFREKRLAILAAAREAKKLKNQESL